MSDKSDIQLVKEAQKGSIESFDLLVIKYQNRLQSIISKYVSNFDDVPDVAQETFLKAYSCLLYTSPSPRDPKISRMPSSA